MCFQEKLCRRCVLISPSRTADGVYIRSSTCNNKYKSYVHLLATPSFFPFFLSFSLILRAKPLAARLNSVFWTKNFLLDGCGSPRWTPFSSSKYVNWRQRDKPITNLEAHPVECLFVFYTHSSIQCMVFLMRFFCSENWGIDRANSVFGKIIRDNLTRVYRSKCLSSISVLSIDKKKNSVIITENRTSVIKRYCF